MKPHHAFFKSEYFKKDRDEDWNLVELDNFNHTCVHHGGTDDEIIQGKLVARQCKEMALARYKGKYREELKKIIKSRYGHLKNDYVKNK